MFDVSCLETSVSKLSIDVFSDVSSFIEWISGENSSTSPTPKKGVIILHQGVSALSVGVFPLPKGVPARPKQKWCLQPQVVSSADPVWKGEDYRANRKKTMRYVLIYVYFVYIYIYVYFKYKNICIYIYMYILYIYVYILNINIYIYLNIYICILYICKYHILYIKRHAPEHQGM